MKRLAASLSLLASCASLSACGGATAPPAALVKDDAAARAEFAKAIAPLYDFSPCARWTPASLEARAIGLMDRERALIARIDANPALKPVADEIRAHIPVEGRDITATECENPNPPPYPRPEAIRERAAEIDEHAAAIDAAERAYAAYQPKARA